jgi:hypothetical protein
MGRTACTESQCLYKGCTLPLPYSRTIPLLPLWAIRPLQSLSACTRVHFTLTFAVSPFLGMAPAIKHISFHQFQQVVFAIMDLLYPFRCHSYVMLHSLFQTSSAQNEIYCFLFQFLVYFIFLRSSSSCWRLLRHLPINLFYPFLLQSILESYSYARCDQSGWPYLFLLIIS